MRNTSLSEVSAEFTSLFSLKWNTSKTARSALAASCCIPLVLAVLSLGFHLPAVSTELNINSVSCVIPKDSKVNICNFLLQSPSVGSAVSRFYPPADFVFEKCILSHTHRTHVYLSCGILQDSKVNICSYFAALPQRCLFYLPADFVFQKCHQLNSHLFILWDTWRQQSQHLQLLAAFPQCWQCCIQM